MPTVAQSLRKKTLESEMITRKQRFQQTAVVWPYTPEPSPKLLPTITTSEVTEDLNMTGAEYVKSRPISVASPREGVLSPGARPTLDDVLNGRAPKPYTLEAYTDFLSQQHCLETLEFTMEAKAYREKYDLASAQMAGMPLSTECDDGYELQQDWIRVLDVYIKPGAPREINIPAEERDDMIDYPYGARPPPPEAFDAAVKLMYELMSNSIFIPFCNSLRQVDHAHTYNALSQFARDDRMDPSRMTYDDRGKTPQRQSSRRHPSPPPKSTSPLHLERHANPAKRKTQSSNLTTGLNRPRSAQLRQLTSNSSAATTGESAVTDNSDSGDSKGPSDAVTPPTTPPGSDLGATMSHNNQLFASPKQVRSDSGGWKKMGMKIWGNKKKGSGSSSMRERSDD